MWNRLRCSHHLLSPCAARSYHQIMHQNFETAKSTVKIPHMDSRKMRTSIPHFSSAGFTGYETGSKSQSTSCTSTYNTVCTMLHALRVSSKNFMSKIARYNGSESHYSYAQKSWQSQEHSCMSFSIQEQSCKFWILWTIQNSVLANVLCQWST